MRKVRQLKLKKTRGTFEIETFQERAWGGSIWLMHETEMRSVWLDHR